MKVLAFDPGAERCGYACIKMGPDYIGSGIVALARGKDGKKPEPYQSYRLRLIQYWIKETFHLIQRYEPDLIVTETIPVVGGGNFVLATQSQLAGTVATTIQAIAFLHGLPVEQIGATTVKKAIGSTAKATKVKVRNGVLKLLPDQSDRAKDWKTVFDESDAIAIALTRLGYSI